MRQRGFTLIELLVVISIIGALSSVVLAGLSKSRTQARDGIRRQSLIQLRTALELYYAQVGSYPITGPGVYYTSNPGGITSDAFYSDNGGNWIPGLVASGAISSLPQDPLPQVVSPSPTCLSFPAKAAYYYRSDDGTSFKVQAWCSPESGIVSATAPLYDPGSPGYSFMVCSGAIACATW